MQALHLPSLTKARFLGRHRGRKAHIVRLDDGTTQMWSDDTTQLLGKNDMTKKIMLTISGSRGKYFDVIDRVFDNVNDANQYLDELMKYNDIKSKHEDKKQGISSATLTNGWKIECNYSITEIMKAKPPQKELIETFPFDLRRSLKQYSMPTKPGTLNDQGELPLDTTTKPKAKSNGKMVQLKDLTKDTRKARVVLRQLVRQKKIPKPARWEWADGSNELSIVKTALGK